MSSPDRPVPLDFGAELWKWDVSLYECANFIKDRRAQANLPTDPDSILTDVTMTLVRDVVDAAGGLERSCLMFGKAVTTLDEAYKLALPRLGSEWVDTEPVQGKFFADRAAEDAWYALEEAIVWARTISERLRRGSIDSKVFPDQGLIPALADGPRREQIMQARSKLLSSGFNEARHLAGLSLHMQSMKGGTAAAKVVKDILTLPFPDPVLKKPSHRWQLTYHQSRDARVVLPNLMRAAEEFMDEMIDALEQNLPARFRS
jgi:hypothetical protein